MDDRWNLLTVCPVCRGLVHLRYESPRQVLGRHEDGIGVRCPMSYRQPGPWDEPTTRAAVQGRSMGVCEYCSAAAATDMHHRKSRGVGGKWHPANIIHLCRDCHSWATHHPSEAGAEAGVGLILGANDKPGLIPVQTKLRGQLWCTDNVTPPTKNRTRRSSPTRRSTWQQNTRQQQDRRKTS